MASWPLEGLSLGGEGGGLLTVLLGVACLSAQLPARCAA